MASGGANTQSRSDLDAEIAEVSAIISRNPREAKSYRKRGLLKARSQRYDEALQDFDRTLKLTPDDGHAYGLRALVWAKKGDRDRAVRDFDEAIRLAPDDYAAIFRSHRERVLAEASEGPVAGGGFNLLNNPFVLLGLSPTAKPAAIKEAYEDAVEDGIVDADVLLRAQQTLLTPRLRIEAEVGGFLDVDFSLAAQIVSDIRSGTPIEGIEERLRKLHSLPRSNVIAHYGSAKPVRLSDLLGLIDAQAAVAPGAVCDAINDVRQENALGRVNRDAVSEALSKLKERQTKAVIETLGSNDEAVAIFGRFVSKIVGSADSQTIFLLDNYVGMFRQTVASELSRRGEVVAALCNDLKKNHRSDATREKLEEALRSWIALARPVQTYEAHRQREDPAAREMYGKVRELALYLSNEEREFESARKIVALASKVFDYLPRAADQMAQDAAQLVELRNDKLADELLTPLFQACEDINKSHRVLETELLRAGFGAGSVGSARKLFDLFKAAVKSTAGFPFSDAPWRLVRSVAISLNNDSSSPQSADRLIQGLLDHATLMVPTAEMVAALSEDQRTVRKNQIENDLTKYVQVQKWKEVEQLAERLLNMETDGEKQDTLRALRDGAQAKLKAAKRVRWFWAVVVAGIILWVVVENNRPSNSGYQPSRTSYQTSPTPSDKSPSSNPYQSPPSSGYQAAPGPSHTVPAPVRSDPFDSGETVPSAGSGRTLSQSNIRYCSYQGVRLEAARPLVGGGGTILQGFNAAIDDYNSRCSNFRYRPSDKEAVDSELPVKRSSLETEGRNLASTWRGTPPSSRQNR
jgi:tetratricopeptide (TPR) repeat protein